MCLENEEVKCAGCDGIFTMDETHYELMIGQSAYDNGSIDIISCESLKSFHLECCDEEAILTQYTGYFTCNGCGHNVWQDDSFWEIVVNKEKAVQNSIEPEWGANLRVYCQGCAQDLDLFTEAIKAIKPVLKEEFRDKVTPMEGTYIPSEIMRCTSCGSRKDKKS